MRRPVPDRPQFRWRCAAQNLPRAECARDVWRGRRRVRGADPLVRARPPGPAFRARNQALALTPAASAVAPPVRGADPLVRAGPPGPAFRARNQALALTPAASAVAPP